jgi:lipopolysaccharide biosynthesis protein
MTLRGKVVKRIGIFCFYDKDGIVDGYVEFLLRELCCCLSSLVIVINGKVNDNGKLILEKYADDIYIRENKGFDGGAYKDVIVNILGWRKIQEYDELVLCNDTFYGPFVPFETIFNEMNNKNVDFWGLNYCEDKILSHLQSYFLVFRKNVINENSIREYFTKNISLSAEKITDIYGEFETGLFYFLVKSGYNFGVYSRSNPFNIYIYSNICIKELKVPIFKKKAFSPEIFVRNNIMDALKYLSHNSNYDLNLIFNNVKRLYHLTLTEREVEEFKLDKQDMIRIEYDVVQIDDEDIKRLILMQKKIYLYGLGIFSMRISKIIDICEGKIEGYIISDDQKDSPEYKNGIRVHKVSEIDNMPDMVIIVALNKKYTQEVMPYLKKFKDVILLWQD